MSAKCRIEADLLSFFKIPSVINYFELNFGVVLVCPTGSDDPNFLNIESQDKDLIFNFSGYVKQMNDSLVNKKYAKFDDLDELIDLGSKCEFSLSTISLIADKCSPSVLYALRALFQMMLNLMPSTKSNIVVPSSGRQHDDNDLLLVENEPDYLVDAIQEEDNREIIQHDSPRSHKKKKRTKKRHKSQPKTNLYETTQTIAPIHPIMQPIKKLRPVIVDGLNVAKYPAGSLNIEQIQSAVEYFENRGHTHITVIMPKSMCNKYELLENLFKRNIVQYVPRRIINGRVEQSHDDLCIIETAHQVDGVILSNDQYRQEIDLHPQYRQFVYDRLLSFIFSGRQLIIPQAVHGNDKPNRDEILCF